MKRARGEENIARLQAMDRTGVDVEQFSPTHIRVFGHEITVDYWPSTGKAWVIGSRDKSSFATPEKVLQLARLTYEESARYR